MIKFNRRTLLQASGVAAASPLAFLLWDQGMAWAEVPSLPILTDHALRYDSPAADWESQALPIGNGRLGAMMFGGPTEERIHLNEQSLWGGVNNYDNKLAGQPDNAFDTSMSGFGSYRNFGNLNLIFEGATVRPKMTAPGGPYNNSSNETVAATIDGNVGTKWCIDLSSLFSPSSLFWQVELPAGIAVAGYALSSANDVPARDPRNWRFEGSDDGQNWTTLDTRALAAPFEQRHMTKRFTFSNTTAYRWYRFVFARNEGVSHWQVAEIALDGVSFSEPGNSGVTDYRRRLDLITGLHTTSFVKNGRRFLREAFASRSADLMIFRYSADVAGVVSGSISLAAGQGATTTVDIANATLRFAGAMGNSLKYAATVKAVAEGGQLSASGTEINFTGCNSLILYVDCRTDYALSAASGWRGAADPGPVADAKVAAAVQKDFGAHRQDHITSFSGIMNRVALTWGASDASVTAMSTLERLNRYKTGQADPSLEQTLLMYGAVIYWPVARAPTVFRPICRVFGIRRISLTGRRITTRTSMSR